MPPSKEGELHCRGQGYRVLARVDRRNGRLKIIDHEGPDVAGMWRELRREAQSRNLGKVIFRVNDRDSRLLATLGGKVEAAWPGFYADGPAYTVSFYPNPAREHSRCGEVEDDILRKIQHRRPGGTTRQDRFAGCVRPARRNDISDLSKLYRQVFATYPTPIWEEGYLEKVFGRRTLFHLAEDNGNVVSAASIELDGEGTAEFTDCVTVPQSRGQGLMNCLARELEGRARDAGVNYLFSLARAGSVGMNMVLKEASYTYGGRLINNCHIGGRFESMNLWVKKMS